MGCVLANSSNAGPSGLSILVVESDPAARRVLLEHLQRHAFRIVESEHGGAAIRAAAAQRFDYVIADIDWVGVSDGPALARWTRTNRPGSKVILTSRTLSHWFPAGNTMATLPIIRKPFRQEDLDGHLSSGLAPAIPGA